MLELIDNSLHVDRSGSAIFEYLLSLPDNYLQIHPSVNFKQALGIGSWYLWWVRRQMTHNGPMPPSWRWPIYVLSIARNFQMSSSHSLELPETKWSKPDPQCTKLNVDATFFADEGLGATSVVLGDDRGNFMLARCKFIPHVANVITVEAMTMRDGLEFANSLGLNQVDVESESLQIINYCNGQTRWWDEATALFTECVDLGSMFGKVMFKHCLRSCTKVAHVLANYSYYNKASISWLNEPPECIVSLLVGDVKVF